MQFTSLPVRKLRITSKFGPRNTGIKGASTNHKGVDIGGESGDTPIFSVASGVVDKNYWNKYRGWVIVIKHDNKYKTLYQHLKAQSSLKIGDRVSSGQTIGIMGASSELLKIARHLHMELLENDIPIDPEPYLKNIKSEDIDMTKEEVIKLIDDRIKLALLGRGETSPSEWAEDIWNKATKEGLVDGKNPKAYVTREQAVVIIERGKNKK